MNYLPNFYYLCTQRIMNNMTKQNKNLRIGTLVSLTEPLIVLCIDGTFRLIYNEFNCSLQIGEVILFEDSTDDYPIFAVLLSEFKYYQNIRCYNRDEFEPVLYKTKGLCIPQKILSENSKFIIDNGDNYQFIIYYKNGNDIYADWRYTKSECDLIRTFFDKKSKYNIDDILTNIDKYLDSTNFLSLIESFTITNEEQFISRPGKDDVYYIEKVSMTFDDLYINSLFPKIKETVYRDSGYCDAYSMRIHPTVRDYIEEEQLLIANAKKEYNKDSHRHFLIAHQIGNILDDIEQSNKKDLNLYKSFLHEIHFLLKNEDVNEEFCRKFNALLRSIYRIATNGEEIGWHHFYDHITR